MGTDNKGDFLRACSVIKREGISDLIQWLENKGDFFTAPASTRYHEAYAGGLVEHSLNVYEELKRVLAAYPEIKCSEESAAICALFHDFCKINFYTTELRNRKNEFGQWEKYEVFKVDEKFCFGGHGSKSVYLVQHFIKLTPEEATAINCHMGSFDNEYVGNSYEQFPLAWALHVADEAATYIRKKDS